MTTAARPRRALNPVTRVRQDAQEEVDRLNGLLKDSQNEQAKLAHDYDQLKSELADTLRAKLALADQVEKLLLEVTAKSNASIKVSEALATFMSNLDADLKILMAAIK